MGGISKDMSSTFGSEKIKAFLNIKYTASWLHNKEVIFLKPFGVSPQQYNILRILRGAKKAVKVQLVKERMIDKSPNITRLMDKLLEKKLIERYRCKDDRRVVFVNITQLGLLLLTKIDKKGKIQYLEGLTTEEAIILSDLLDKIR
jgi:DNA-binding MarR family transcriptional regulator